MNKVEFHIQPDEVVAKLRALIISGMIEPEKFLTAAIYEAEIEVRKTRGNRVYKYSKEERLTYEKQLEIEIKRLPPYWFTDAEAEVWYKEYDEKNKYDNTIFEKIINNQKNFLEALKNINILKT